MNVKSDAKAEVGQTESLEKGSVLKEILEANQKFIQQFQPVKLSHHPRKKIAVVTCMDTRLVDFLEPAMGLKRGDAKIIKNAGNTVPAEVIRSLAAAIYSLGVKEVLVVGHTHCGMAHVDEQKLANSMRENGISEEVIAGLNLKEWIGAISDEESNVKEMVKEIKASPVIPSQVPVHGLIIDIETGMLRVVA
ncbi:beta-class carbonic anhydrase [Thermanaerosceptrum fracticalcis]|uniref:beta-class carbonic anhydrase n=1 Tax=Thermanaerosceptrum fracticalcis TaxID=1712410 RepID=UPI000A87ECD6|nr:carbonic anhydrase [Thermanaerosceptrum fracticalcis]